MEVYVNLKYLKAHYPTIQYNSKVKATIVDSRKIFAIVKLYKSEVLLFIPWKSLSPVRECDIIAQDRRARRQRKRKYKRKKKKEYLEMKYAFFDSIPFEKGICSESKPQSVSHSVFWSAAHPCQGGRTSPR
jgi:hypothetical protein